MEKMFTGRVTKKNDSVDQENGKLLNFYGVVTDNKSMDVEYATVMVFACFTGGIEKPLAYTFTDQEGRYFITIPKPPDNHELVGFKVRAGKPHRLSNEFDYPVDCHEVLYKQPERDTVQHFVKNCIPIQDNISNKAIFNVPKEGKIAAKVNLSVPAKHSVGLIKLGKAGECEYYPYSPVGVIFFEPNQPPAFDALQNTQPHMEPIKEIEKVPRKSEFISTAFFLLVLTLFCIFYFAPL